MTGQKGEQPELLHQGIPLSFKQSFNLADHVKVVGANVEHGLLTIDLVREVPEQLKPRRIEIGAARRDEGCEAGQSAEADRHQQRQEGRVICETEDCGPPPGPRPGGPDCGEWR